MASLVSSLYSPKRIIAQLQRNYCTITIPLQMQGWLRDYPMTTSKPARYCTLTQVWATGWVASTMHNTSALASTGKGEYSVGVAEHLAHK